MKRWLAPLLAGMLLGVVILLLRPHAYGAAGDLITTIPLPVAGSGVSVGADCEGGIYFTNAGDARLHKINRNGALVSSVPTKDANTEDVFIDEIAWDQTRQLFWGAEHGVFPV